MNYKAIYTLTLLLSLVFNGFSQTTIRNELNNQFMQNFTFENESAPTIIIIDVGSPSDLLEITIDSKIDEGILQATLINPDNRREGGFELKCNSKSGNSHNKKESSVSNTNTNSNSNSNASSNSNSNSSISVSVNSGSSTGAKGNMKKTIDNPQTGAWKLIIDTQNVTGIMRVGINQKE